MLSNKIRTAAAGLAAICALAVAAGPAAAESKWGHLGIGQQGNVKVSDTFCDDIQTLYNGDISAMQADIKAGNYAGSFQNVNSAAQHRSDARNAGCAWAWT